MSKTEELVKTDEYVDWLREADRQVGIKLGAAGLEAPRLTASGAADRLEAQQALIDELVGAGNELADKAQVLRVNCGAYDTTRPTEKARLLEDMKAVLDAEDKWVAALNSAREENSNE